MKRSDSDTVVLVDPKTAAEKYFVHEPVRELTFQFGAASHPGLIRPDNQDHYLVLRRERIQFALLSNMPACDLTLDPDVCYAMAVADGMGGMGRGDLASRLAIKTAWDLAGRTMGWIMKVAQLNTSEMQERAEGFIHLMQQAFIEEAQVMPELEDSGTTWTCAYFASQFAVTANVGDSPSFLWRDGTMRRLSTDHTVEQDLLSMGVNQKIACQYANVLTRCFGARSRDARPEVRQLRLRAGDQLLICTDGLTDMVSEGQIAGCLDQASSAQEACDRLVALALAVGGKDNVTAVLARTS